MHDRKVFDRVLIDPSAGDLEAVLREARTVANEGNTSKTKLATTWTLPELPQFLETVATTPDGLHGWHGGAKRKYYGGKSQVIVAWWTNPLGEKHIRVLGGHGTVLCERLCIAENGSFYGGPTMSYAEVLYAERTARVLNPNDNEMLVGVCPCGAVGSFPALGWTGPCCGPCRDHQEEGHTLPVRSWETDIRYGPTLTFDPAGGALFYASEQLRRIDLTTGTVETVPHPPSVANCRKLTFLPDGKRAVLFGWPGGHETAVAVWESGTTAISEWHLSADYKAQLCLSPDGETVAVTHIGNNKAKRALTLRSVHDGSVLRQLGTPDVRELLFSPDGQLLLVVPWNTGPKVWDTQTGKIVCETPEKELAGATCSPDGRDVYVFSHTVAGKGATYDTDRVRIHMLKFPGHRDMAYSLGFTTASPDGKVLLAGISSSLHFWTLPATGVSEWVKLSTVCDTFQKCAWSPDGRWLVTTGINGMIRMWPWPAVYEAARAART